MPSLPKDVSESINSDIDSLLSDGEWHDFSEFVPIGSHIPAEIASRFYASGNAPKTVANKPINEQVLRGRRQVLDRRLWHRVRSGRAEIEGGGFHKRLRLIPANDVAKCVDLSIEAIKSIARQLPNEQQQQLVHVLVANRLNRMTSGILTKMANSYLERLSSGA